MTRLLAAVIALLSVLLAPALAAEHDPTGLWEIEYRDSRYDVSLCGDGTQLCGTLIWLGKGADIPKNLPYLNTMVINAIKKTGPNRWEGGMNLYGQRVSGTVNMLDAKTFLAKACVLFILCQEVKFYRVD